MYSRHESPGSIRYQVGRSIDACRDCVRVEDVPSLLNHLRFLIALGAPHLKEKGKRLADKLRAVDKDDADHNVVFSVCMEVFEEVLILLAEKKLYAYIEPETRDAGDLSLTAEVIAPTMEDPTT